jgi:hypothetical protein
MIVEKNSKVLAIGSLESIKVSFKDILLSMFFGYFSYSTVREAKIHSFFIAVVYRLLQAAILTYIIGYI